MQKEKLLEEIMEEYQRVCKQMEQNQYVRVEHLIPRWTATFFGILTPLPVAILVYWLFELKWQRYETELPVGVTGMVLTLVVLFGSIAVHEWMHCFFWSIKCKNGWKGVNYVFIWSALMPLSHCREPLESKWYLTGVLAPFFLMGGGFSILSLIFPSRLLLLAALVNLLCAGGDLLIAFNLAGCRNAYVFDHPIQCGFAAFFGEKEKSRCTRHFYRKRQHKNSFPGNAEKSNKNNKPAA